MNVLSLFDGMSCGQQALKQAGFQLDQYFASEIDSHAMEIAMKNFPKTVQLGDVRGVRAKDLPKIDLLLAGSPCQGFSRSGKGLNFDDPRSALFFEFVRILNEVRQINPGVKFLLENVDMLQEWQDIISKAVDIQPVKINSALVCAQNRVRLYWTNIGTQADMFGNIIPGIMQPKDRGLVLKYILEQEVDEKYFLSDKALRRISTGRDFSAPKINPNKTGSLNPKNNSGQLSTDSGTTLVTDKWFEQNYKDKDKDKANTLTSTMFKGSFANGQSLFDVVVHNKMPRTGGNKRGGTGHLSRSDGKTYCLNHCPDLNQIEFIPGVINHQEFVETGEKSMNLDATYFKGPDNHGQRTVVQVNTSTESGGKQPYQQNRVYDKNGKSPALVAELSSGTHAINTSRIRRLTPIECERLQGLPDNYTSGVSDTQRYKMLGNGWQIDTIVHILKHL